LEQTENPAEHHPMLIGFFHLNDYASSQRQLRPATLTFELVQPFGLKPIAQLRNQPIYQLEVRP
jgi:hypothetical protein